MTENQGYQSTESLKNELNRVEKKKKRALDAFFSGDISKADLAMMNQEYDDKIKKLTEQIDLSKKRSNLDYDTDTIEADVKKHVTDIVNCESENEAFYGSLFDHITVYPKKQLVVHLKLIPTKWWYIIEGLSGFPRHSGASEMVDGYDVPISVSIPATSR